MKRRNDRREGKEGRGEMRKGRRGEEKKNRRLRRKKRDGTEDRSKEKSIV